MIIFKNHQNSSYHFCFIHLHKFSYGTMIIIVLAITNRNSILQMGRLKSEKDSLKLLRVTQLVNGGGLYCKIMESDSRATILKSCDRCSLYISHKVLSLIDFQTHTEIIFSCKLLKVFFSAASIEKKF